MLRARSCVLAPSGSIWSWSPCRFCWARQRPRDRRERAARRGSSLKAEWGARACREHERLYGVSWPFFGRPRTAITPSGWAIGRMVTKYLSGSCSETSGGHPAELALVRQRSLDLSEGILLGSLVLFAAVMTLTPGPTSSWSRPQVRISGSAARSLR